MKYLVTGGAGFIASVLIKKLVKQGHDCVTIDNLTTGLKENIHPKCEFIEGDLFDVNIIKELEQNHRNFDAIFHIAGQSSGEISFDDPVYDLQSNTQSTLLLLDYAKRNNIKKFIFASTMSTYGDQENIQVNEDLKLNPKSFYAVGKIASENYLNIYSKFGICCTSLRFFNVYGPGQDLGNLRQGMVSIYLAQAISKEHHILVKGSKDRFRDFIYVEDVVDATIKSLDLESGYDVFNVSTNKPTTVDDVIKTLKENLPFEVTTEFASGTPGDQFGIYGDNSKIKSILGWQPKVDFENGLKNMIDWALLK